MEGSQHRDSLEQTALEARLPVDQEPRGLRASLDLRRELRSFLEELTDWPILRFRLVLRLARPWRGEGFVTPYLRSALGLGLSEQERARLPGSERALERLFRPDQNAPTPFLLIVPELEPGQLEFFAQLHLLGEESCQNVDAFVRALLRGRLGKLPFRLRQIEQGVLNEDLGLTWVERPVNSFGLLTETRSTPLADWALHPHPMPLRRIQSPQGLLLGRDGSPRLSLPFLTKAAFRRLRDLSRAFSRQLVSEAEWRRWNKLVEDEAKLIPWSLEKTQSFSSSRFSARQQVRHPIRGQVFQMNLDDALGLTRPLFAACALTGLGRKTSMGLGRIELKP